MNADDIIKKGIKTAVEKRKKRPVIIEGEWTDVGPPRKEVPPPIINIDKKEKGK